MDKNLYLKIQRPGNQCLNCGADLSEAQKHGTIINVDDNEENLSRQDFCTECWEKTLQGEDFFSRWIAKREIPEERTRISRQDRNRLLLALFELISAGGEAAATTGEGELPVGTEAIRYFLGHLLMRFRVFKWHRTESASGTIFFENTTNGETYAVQPMDLDDDTILKIKQVVEDFLRKGQDLDVSL